LVSSVRYRHEAGQGLSGAAIINDGSGEGDTLFN
jgi:hypothetical protein